jgi:hypothetical protein
LAAKIKARIFTHPKVFIPALEISHDGKAVVLRGGVHTPREYYLEVGLVHALADPHPIRNEWYYRK